MPDLDRIIEVGTASARVPDALDIRWTELYVIPGNVINDQSPSGPDSSMEGEREGSRRAS